MAKKQKPAFKPKWATKIDVYDGRLNAAKPPAEREEEGWRYLEKPPRQYLNWLHHWTGEWIDYLEEAVGSGGKRPATITVAAPDAAEGWEGSDFVVEAGKDAAKVIQQALAALPPHGGRVLLSDGTFSIKTCVDFSANLPGPVWLQGQGPGTTFLIDGDKSFPAVAISTGHPIIISNLAIRRSESATGTHCGGIYCDTGIDVRVNLALADVTVEGMKKGGAEEWSGIALFGRKADIFATGLKIGFTDQSSHPIRIETYSNLRLRRSRIYWPGKSGSAKANLTAIKADYSNVDLADSEIADCKFAIDCAIAQKVDLRGLKISAVNHALKIQQADARIVGCQIESQGRAVHAIACKPLQITGCQITATGNNGTAITLAATSGSPPKAVEKARIVGNNISRADMKAVIILSADGCLLADNSITDAKPTAIEAGGRSVIIANNYITAPSSNNNIGIDLKGETCEARGNSIAGYNTGIKISGTDSVVAGNHVLKAHTAIDLTECLTRHTIRDNTIRGATYIGIRREPRGTAETIIAGNLIEGKNNVGIQAAGKRLHVTNNLIWAGREAAIFLKDGGPAMISENLIFCMCDGIKIGYETTPPYDDYVRYVTVASNKIFVESPSGNTHAIRAHDNSDAIHIVGNYCSYGKYNIRIAKNEASVIGNVSVAARDTHISLGEVTDAMVVCNTCIGRSVGADYGLVVDATSSRDTVVSQNRLRGSANTELRVIGQLSNIRVMPAADHNKQVTITAVECNDVDPAKVQIG